MSTAANQRGPASRRPIRLLFLLQGHVFDGVRLRQLAEALDTTPSSALRDLQMLEDEGVVERIPGRDEYWRLSPRLVQLAKAHEQELVRLRQRIDETEQRYSRVTN